MTTYLQADDAQETDPLVILKYFVDRLEKYSSKNHFTIVLDDMDFEPRKINEVVNWIVRFKSKSRRFLFIITTQKDIADPKNDSGLAKIYRLEDFGKEDVKNMLRDIELTDETIEMVISCITCLPLSICTFYNVLLQEKVIIYS